MRLFIYFINVALILLVFTTNSFAQKKKRNQKAIYTSEAIDPAFKDAIKFRELGPFRGGRSAAVTGIPGNDKLYYFGAAGGGVWKTEDAGETYKNISDGFFGGSIGAVAVSEYDNNVIYAGGGEVTVRGNVSSGYGMWKSEDAGKTWEQKGLKDSRHIVRIRIHPRDPNTVFAAALGNIYKANEQRGIFKSIDGGNTLKKVLFVNNEAGAVDLTFDPNNPRIMYGGTWRVKRSPYDMSSGGEGSALWKSTDGGNTWEDISKNEGMPKGVLGISGITVSPANSNRVWAIIEAKEGGVFRSEDAGKTWSKINTERKLRQRAWYYTRIYADTKDENTVYVLNVQFHKSTDGGKTFKRIRTPHSDHHDLWIAPENPQRMIIADDGGAQVSNNGGASWSTYMNQPTAQFYRVTTDDDFPYRIYVAQQDNSAIRIKHRSLGGSISEDDWESTAGCECGHLAIDPTDNDIVYGGCYDGYLGRKNHKTNQSRNISVWPDNPMGHGAEGMRYRFQWNFPIFFSKHNKKRLYTCSNVVHASDNGGQSWEIISPDLTTNDSTKMKSSGGPITKDNTSVEYYCTIFAGTESNFDEGTLWVGSDDGLVHITRDGGKNWNNITPTNLPKWCMINSIEADPHDAGGAYIAATSYKSGDFRPYLFKTKNYGQTWTKIVNGIGDEHFTRVVRADPEKKGILYAGTETGAYISFDDGNSWQSFQLNLPIVPITDMTIKNNNLIVATQGRSVWILDDLSFLHQIQNADKNKDFILFQPKTTYRMDGGDWSNSKIAGTNHPSGLVLNYYIKALQDTSKVSLTLLDTNGKEIRTYSNKAKEKSDKIKVKEGINTYNWNLSYPAAKKFDGMILWWGSLGGPKAIPGKYQAKLTVDDRSEIVDFEILKNPNNENSQKDFEKQFDFISDIGDKLTESHEAIIEIRDIRKQMKNYLKRLEDSEHHEELKTMFEATDSSMMVIEEALYQTKNQSSQDPLNFPIKLTNKLAHLNSITRGGDYPPTDQAIGVKDELVTEIDKYLADLETIKKVEIPKFNQAIREREIDAIILKEKE